MRVGDELVKVKATPTAGKDACLLIGSVRARKEQVRCMQASKRGSQDLRVSLLACQ